MNDDKKQKTVEELAKEHPEYFDDADMPPMSAPGDIVEKIRNDPRLSEPTRKLMLEMAEQRKAENSGS